MGSFRVARGADPIQDGGEFFQGQVTRLFGKSGSAKLGVGVGQKLDDERFRYAFNVWHQNFRPFVAATEGIPKRGKGAGEIYLYEKMGSRWMIGGKRA